MSERKRHHSFQHIYDVVARGDPKITKDLQEVELFLRTVSAESKKPEYDQKKVEEPPALDNTLFTQIFKELGHKRPLVVLRRAIEEEHRRKKQALTSVEEDPGSKISQEETPIKKNPVFRKKTIANEENPVVFTREGYITADEVAKVRNLTPRYVRSKLLDLPGKVRDGKSVFYPRESALNTFIKSEGVKREKELFIPPEGYLSRKEVREQFPEISRNRLFSIFPQASYIKGIDQSRYYLKEEIQTLIEAKKREDIQKEKEKALKRQRVPKAPRGQFKKILKFVSKRTKIDKLPYSPDATAAGIVKKDLIYKLPRPQERVTENDVIHVSISELQRSGVIFVRSTLDLLLKDLPTIPGLGKSGRVVRLYPEEKALRLLSQHEENKKDVDKKLDPNLWAIAKTLGIEYGIPPQVIPLLLEEDVTTKNWRELHWYKRNESEPKILEYLSKLPEHAGVYLRKGKMWAPLYYYNKRFNVSYPKLREELNSVSTTSGEGDVTLYAYDETIEKLDPYIIAPAVDQSTGIYTDDKEERWAPESVICDLLGISLDKLRTYSDKVAKKDVRARNKRLVLGYNISQIEENAAEYLERPAKKDTGMLLTAQTLASEYDLPLYTVKKQLRSIGISIRGSGKQKQYPELQAKDILHKFVTTPEVDLETEEYRDDNGDIYVTQAEGFRRVKGGKKYFDQALMHSSVQKLEGRRGYTSTTLYRLKDISEAKEKILQEKLPVVHKPKDPQ